MNATHLSAQLVPAQMPPPPPPASPETVAQFAAGRPGAFTDKQTLDLEMRKQFGALWRDVRVESSQTKAQQREQDNAHTAAYLEQKDNAGEPGMSSREHFDLDLHWSVAPGRDDDAASRSAKRSTANAQGDSPWQHLYTKPYNDIFQDQANLQSFYNEINGRSCSGDTCSSGTDVFLDWTGSWPQEGREPFTYPVLIDNNLRIFKPEAFRAVGMRLHAVSIPAPYPYMNDRPPFNREAVPVLASSSECAHITPYHPASCASFSAGEQVAQIDKFFSENIAKGKVPGAVFVDAAVIEKWGKESSMKGTTALAVRLDPDHLAVIFGLVGGGFAFISGICCCIFSDALKKCPGAVASRVRSGWDGCKSVASALWNRCTRVRTPLAPPPQPAAQAGEGEESSIVVDSVDSSSDSAYLGDFSSSSSSSEASTDSEKKAGSPDTNEPGQPDTESKSQ